MAFLHGRPLSLEDLERIRLEIESFDNIDVIDDEIRGIVARNWPTCWRSSHPRKIEVARGLQPPPQPATWTIYRVLRKPPISSSCQQRS
jgi:hypothetical protein